MYKEEDRSVSLAVRGKKAKRHRAEIAEDDNTAAEVSS